MLKSYGADVASIGEFDLWNPPQAPIDVKLIRSD